MFDVATLSFAICHPGKTLLEEFVLAFVIKVLCSIDVDSQSNLHYNMKAFSSVIEIL